MKTVKKQSLGFHRNKKRVWINHGTVIAASFAAGDRVEHCYDGETGELAIQRSESGTHKIADTHKGAVIDINNAAFSHHFADFSSVEVIAENGVITIKGHHAENLIIEREETLKRRVETGEPLRKGGAFTGMGLLCRSVHDGLKQAGINVQQRFANDINAPAAEVNIGGNPLWDDAASDAVFSIDDIYTMNMDIVPKLDILVMGSPCPAFSSVNTHHQKSGKKDIYHAETGTIFQPMLEMIRRANPALVILENSKHFSGSVFDYIMSDVMTRFGYVSQETIVSGTQFGDFEKRERLCRVWRSKGLDALSLDQLPYTQANTRPFSSILEPIGTDDKRWGRRKYLEAKDSQEGNGHQYCITSPDATTIPTCGANYHKIQPDSAMIPHPSQPLITRIMTPSEHCNLRGVTGDYKKNVLAIESGTHYSQSSNRGSATEAHKMLGNSCSPKPWFSLGCRIGEWLKGGKPQSDIAETARPAPIAAHVDPDDQFAFNF